MYTLYLVYYLLIPKPGIFLMQSSSSKTQEFIADYRVISTYKTEQECLFDLYNLKSKALFTMYLTKDKSVKIVVPEAECIKTK